MPLFSHRVNSGIQFPEAEAEISSNKRNYSSKQSLYTETIKMAPKSQSTASTIRPNYFSQKRATAWGSGCTLSEREREREREREGEREERERREI